MKNEHVLTVTDANFEQLASVAATPLLLDFGATWCPPCRAMEPHVEALATSYAGRVRVGACNIDDNPAVATRFGIMSAPTFVLLRDGEVVERIVGAVPRSRLDAVLRRSLEG